MCDMCNECPKRKEFIDLGGCPNCGAKKLLMNTNTHMATCDACGMTVGIPMAIEGLCEGDKHSKLYTISIHAKLDKEQLLIFSKILGFNSVKAFNLFKSNIPVVIENVPMVTAYELRNYLQSAGVSITIGPTIDEYPWFEECWRIQKWKHKGDK